MRGGGAGGVRPSARPMLGKQLGALMTHSGLKRGDAKAQSALAWYDAATDNFMKNNMGFHVQNFKKTHHK